MRALVLKQPKQLVMENVPAPVVPEGWVSVRPLAVSICGSDYHSYRGENALLTYPRILGHEVCGEVEKAPADSGFASGDKVILMPYLSCGTCKPCRKGKTNCCTRLSVYGVHRDGALAEYFVAPLSQLIKVKGSTDPKMAALVEPLSISMHAVARSGASKGDFVLVSGAGPIGMGAALMARLEGANVAITDTNAERRRFAKEVFGIPLILDPLGSDYKGKLEDWTNGEMPDIIINSTGNNQSMAADVPMLSNGGRLVWVGISNAKIAIDGTAFHLRETELYDSRAAFRCDFDNVLAAIESKKLDPLQMITHSAHFPDAEDAFKEWESLRGAVFKAIILMD